ncbi:MAG: hypothetical protein ACTSYU_04945 [Promethearchaeota archaeon]
MASTVRISNIAKLKMQKLIHYLGFKSNQKLSQRQILDILIDSGLQHKEELLKMIDKKEKIVNWRKDPILDDMDLDLDEYASETIDKVIYSEINE